MKEKKESLLLERKNKEENEEVVITDQGLCIPYIKSYMTMNSQKNDVEQVRKLQKFLVDNEGERLLVTGTFDINTHNAVLRLQEKYKKEILLPWGLTSPTGYVYKTTIAHINRRMCGAKIQCPVFSKYHKVGDVGGEVPQIQRFLKDLQYYDGEDNGVFDQKLESSISRFQNEFSPMVLEP